MRDWTISEVFDVARRIRSVLPGFAAVVSP